MADATLRELERALIKAAVEHYLAGERIDVDEKEELKRSQEECTAEQRLEKAMDALHSASLAYIQGTVARALDATEEGGPRESVSRYGDGRVFKRGEKYWIAYYVDGQEIRQPAGYSEAEARTALVERKAIEDYSASLPQPREESKDMRLLRRMAEDVEADRAKPGHKMPPKSTKHEPKPNRTCAGCEKPFHAVGRTLRCERCRKEQETATKTPAKIDGRTVKHGPTHFADTRCLDCEEPFKSFNGAKRCEGCIQARLEKKAPGVNTIEAGVVTAGEDEVDEVNVRSRLVP
jgi:hypothetical protein